MIITMDYNNEKDNPSYWNDVMEAIDFANKTPFLDEVEFNNFPFGEIKDILRLISKATNKGVIEFTYKSIIYTNTDEKLFVKFS